MRIMKPLSVFMVWGILFFCLPSDAPTQQRVRDYTSVNSAEELKKLINSEKDILIIDNRSISSYHQRGHIPGAKDFEFPNANISMDQWDNSAMGGKSKEDFIGLLGENKDRPIVFYSAREW